MKTMRKILGLILIAPATGAYAVGFQVSDLHIAAMTVVAKDIGMQTELSGTPAMETAPVLNPAADAGTAAFRPAFRDMLFESGQDFQVAAPGAMDLETPPAGIDAGVPGPAAIWAVGLGLIGFAGIARRRAEQPDVRAAAAVDAAGAAVSA